MKKSRIRPRLALAPLPPPPAGLPPEGAPVPAEVAKAAVLAVLEKHFPDWHFAELHVRTQLSDTLDMEGFWIDFGKPDGGFRRGRCNIDSLAWNERQEIRTRTREAKDAAAAN